MHLIGVAKFFKESSFIQRSPVNLTLDFDSLVQSKAALLRKAAVMRGREQNERGRRKLGDWNAELIKILYK